MTSKKTTSREKASKPTTKKKASKPTTKKKASKQIIRDFELSGIAFRKGEAFVELSIKMSFIDKNRKWTQEEIDLIKAAIIKLKWR